LTISTHSMMGSLFEFISSAAPKYFQPMPPNFGILPELPVKIKSKPERYGAYRDRSLAAIAALAPAKIDEIAGIREAIAV
jgi:methylenetetrahydrofolate--tRNA-(uracil-5-)-methyltransferase